MVHGKKGFDRLVYTCKNALQSPMPWLVSSPSATKGKEPANPVRRHLTPADTDFLAKYQPSKLVVAQAVGEAARLKLPDLDVSNELEDPSKADAMELAADIYEWLSLARLGSPRVQSGDKIDPYLSSYEVPRNDGSSASVRTIRWHGFIQPAWTRHLLAEVISHLPPKSWFALSSTAFGTSVTGESPECVVLRPPNAAGKYLLWDIKNTS
jgi:ribonucleases P/MRP protein subunit RPP40